jgi:hypothetical protein
LIYPFDTEKAVKETEADIEKIKVPAYTGAGWYAYTYKCHLQGCQNFFRLLKGPKKILFPGPAHLERPFHSFHHEILRWYDHWLKGMDTGIMEEPPVKYWVMGPTSGVLGMIGLSLRRDGPNTTFTVGNVYGRPPS